MQARLRSRYRVSPMFSERSKIMAEPRGQILFARSTTLNIPAIFCFAHIEVRTLDRSYLGMECLEI